MFKNFKIFLFSLLLLSPVTVGAAFDFVVDQAVTISNPTPVEGQTVKLYTVVVNNDFPVFSGNVDFFNNGQKIGTAEVKKLSLEEARQVSISFVVPAGTLTVTTQLSGVTVTKKDGGTQTLTDAEVKNTRPPAVFEIDADSDKDGIGNKVDPDDDNDGVIDTKELELGTDPLKVDTDGDGVSDQEEITKKTDPKKADTDGDGVNDATDVFPLDAKETLDFDKDGIGDNADPDDDNDGLSDEKEKAVGADPLKPDSDNDSVVDGDDALPLDAAENKDTDADKIGDNADPDDDNDQISDEEEKNLGTDAQKSDTDNDGVTDYEEKLKGTDPLTGSVLAQKIGLPQNYTFLFNAVWKQAIWLGACAFLAGWLAGYRRGRQY